MSIDWTDYYNTPHVICPHCGTVYEDDIYFLESSTRGDVETCEECGKKFRFDVNYEITFTTRPLPEPSDPSA